MLCKCSYVPTGKMCRVVTCSVGVQGGIHVSGYLYSATSRITVQKLPRYATCSQNVFTLLLPELGSENTYLAFRFQGLPFLQAPMCSPLLGRLRAGARHYPRSKTCRGCCSSGRFMLTMEKCASFFVLIVLVSPTRPLCGTHREYAVFFFFGR